MLDARLLQEVVVRAEDRVGVLADVCRILGDMGIALISVFVHSNGGTARLHLVTTSQTYARDALRDAGFTVEQREVVVVTLRRHPGFLCRISEVLARKDIGIEELYATAPEDDPAGVVIFTCSNPLHAVQLLRGR